VKKLLLIIPLVLIILLIYFFPTTGKKTPKLIEQTKVADESQPTTTPEQEDVNYTASFEIRTNGIKRDFSAVMYHNLSQDVYIENPDPSIIHVKKTSITWAAFFETLPMRLHAKCLITGTNEQFCTEGNNVLRFLINDEENPEALDQVINEGDRLVVTFGSS
jgi:hypothetical protein